jgi:hypothetical protein
LRKAIIGEHDVRSARERLGIGRRYRGDARIPIGNDGALAARIDENRRQGGRQAIDALAGAGLDRFTRQSRQHAVAVFVRAGRPAERAREHGAAAETRDRDRRVGRAAAIDGEERLGLDLAVVARKLIDAKHLVEHDNAGAENARRGTRVRALVRHQRVSTSLP